MIHYDFYQNINSLLMLIKYSMMIKFYQPCSSIQLLDFIMIVGSQDGVRIDLRYWIGKKEYFIL